ncbi:hypothetical protein ABT075_11370 [Streptomyces sp. NPDC002677]|uniref:hypothetical protein n=1 Tax=Streptomyces sp. NPDC002677 TaxID=3154774 RepID=UPI0033267BE9
MLLIPPRGALSDAGGHEPERGHTGGGTRPPADGNRLSVLGPGVWQVPDGRACADAVRWAPDAGHRPVDTAQACGDEASVGRALRDSGGPRGEVSVTTKFQPRDNDPVGQLENDLRRLGVEQDRRSTPCR